MDPSKSLLCNRFKVGKRVGCGTYGEVYSGLDLTTQQACALKLEALTAVSPQLKGEAKALGALRSVHGVPTLYWSGSDSSYNVISMELLGPSFDQLLERCKGKFSLKTGLLVGDQMIQRLESIHQLNYIHRDIKPDNFTLGLHRAEKLIYLIDFGLAKRYRHPITKQHIPYRENSSLGLVGTLRYASVNAHLGMELSRRDDLEALFYMLIYFVRGSLPWQGALRLSKDEKYSRVLELKQTISYHQLCKDLPACFSTALRYIRGLQFDSAPNYDYLLTLLRDTRVQLKLMASVEYDWMLVQSATLPVAPCPTKISKQEESSGSTMECPLPSLRADARERVRRIRSMEMGRRLI